MSSNITVIDVEMLFNMGQNDLCWMFLLSPNECVLAQDGVSGVLVVLLSDKSQI